MYIYTYISIYHLEQLGPYPHGKKGIQLLLVSQKLNTYLQRLPYLLFTNFEHLQRILEMWWHVPNETNQLRVQTFLFDGLQSMSVQVLLSETFMPP